MGISALCLAQTPLPALILTDPLLTPWAAPPAAPSVLPATSALPPPTLPSPVLVANTSRRLDRPPAKTVQRATSAMMKISRLQDATLVRSPPRGRSHATAVLLVSTAQTPKTTAHLFALTATMPRLVLPSVLFALRAIRASTERPRLCAQQATIPWQASPDAQSAPQATSASSRRQWEP